MSSDEDEYDELESDPKAALEYSVGWFIKERPKPTKHHTGLVYDDRMLLHHHPRHNHPECPDRVATIMAALKATGLAERMYSIPVSIANDSDLLRVHSSTHVATVQSFADPLAREVRYYELEKHSAYASEGSEVSAYVAAGAVVSAAEHVAQGIVRNALCVVRPPGHHAEKEQICGFCLFDNVAVAASAAIARMGMRKILVFDWDIHHGNGIQHAFEDSDQVLYISIHRWERGDFYPGGEDGGPTKTGTGKGLGFNINIAWNDAEHRFNDRDYCAAFDCIVMPAARAFNPDLIMISAGFDAAIGDPLGGCEVSPSAYGYMLRNLSSLAEGRVLVVLEGGYHLSAITASMLVCANILLGDPFPIDSKHDSKGVHPSAKESIIETIEAHRNLDVKFSRAWTGMFSASSYQQQDMERGTIDHSNLYSPSQDVGMMDTDVHSPSQDEHNDNDEIPENAINESPDAQLFVNGPTVSMDVTRNQLSFPPTNCPLPQPKTPCHTCGGTTPGFTFTVVCLSCYIVSCSNKDFKGHAEAHAIDTGHKVALRLEDLVVYDFDRGHLNYMHDPELLPIINVFHEQRFGHKIPVPRASLETAHPSSPLS